MFKLTNWNQIETLRNAIIVAKDRYKEDEKVFLVVAASLRAGQPNPMFAPGELGAVAADRLAAQFNLQQAECLVLLNAIDRAEDARNGESLDD